MSHDAFPDISREMDERQARLDEQAYEREEQTVREELLTRLEMRERAISREYFAWLTAQNPLSFIESIHNPECRTHNEIIERWRRQWVDLLLLKDHYADVAKRFEL